MEVEEHREGSTYHFPRILRILVLLNSTWQNDIDSTMRPRS